MLILNDPVEFEWDKGNINKNFIKHKVTNTECEEVFFDENKKILNEGLYSGNELRYIVIGKTKSSRILFNVFTIRNKKIRVISARDLNRKEKKLYYEP